MSAVIDNDPKVAGEMKYHYKQFMCEQCDIQATRKDRLSRHHQSGILSNYHWKKHSEFPLAQMVVLTPGSAHA